MPEFAFKKFKIRQEQSAMKVNTDGILIGAWTNLDKAVKILDIGSGTGLISLMIAQRNPNAEILAIEPDKASYEESQNNFINSIYQERLKILNTSLQTYSISTNAKHTLIISNPPFFSNSIVPLDISRANARHTLTLSHLELIQGVKRLLEYDGSFDVILPYLSTEKFIDLAEQNDLYLQSKTDVYGKKSSKIIRNLMRFGFAKNNNVFFGTLEIYNDDKTGTYTQDYINLTKEFYINM